MLPGDAANFITLRKKKVFWAFVNHEIGSLKLTADARAADFSRFLL